MYYEAGICQLCIVPPIHILAQLGHYQVFWYTTVTGSTKYRTYQQLTLKDAFIQDNIMEFIIQTMYVTS